MDKLGSESGHASALDATVTLSTVNYDSSKKVKFVKYVWCFCVFCAFGPK